MQRMPKSYKCVKAQKENQWVCTQLACSRRPRAILRKPIIGIYKPSYIMKISHQYMKVTTQETLYHEDHGATLKHKCGKGQQHCPFSLFLSFFVWALWPLSIIFFVGNFGLFFLFPHMGQCSNNDDHHTFIYSQLKAQNDDDSIGNASGSVPGCATIQLGV